MTDRRPRIVIVGGAAAGTLTAAHLTRQATRRGTPLDLDVLDPADRLGRGVAFGTGDDQHLLNVVAGNMSAWPEDPGHFAAWRCRQRPGSAIDAWEFAPRRDYGRYLDETLAETLAPASTALQHRRDRAVGLGRTASGVAVRTSAGDLLEADAVVLATGLGGPRTSWAPESLRSSPFFVADPWAPGALDVVRRDAALPPDVLLVGTGLTMVDVTVALARDARPGRVLRAISRHGALPATHVVPPGLAAVPDIDDWGGGLDDLRARVTKHVAEVSAATGDWRHAVDGLRVHTSALWARLSEQDRARFLREDASDWNVARHRMPPWSRALLDDALDRGELEIGAGQVADCQPLTGGGLRVHLADGTTHDVGWVVNCTGPDGDRRHSEDPLLRDLLDPTLGHALAVPATAGMGFLTEHGRLVDSHGRADAPIWTLGSLRQGELWESTAIPEIRSQAQTVATAVLDTLVPLPRVLADGRVVGGHHPVARPRDPLGLPLSTTAEAAASFNAGLERVMRLQSGGEELIAASVELDPDFAVGHAALAMLGHEAGAACDVTTSLRKAQAAARAKGDERERSLVEVVTQRVADVRGTGAQALVSHLARHPRDVLAVSAAVPTIAFSGVTDVQREAWDLVEGLAPAYGDHWWYISLLAFTRQDQERFDEAGLLAEAALSCEPSSGHAVHAQTHVMYETGQHVAGQAWLDHWVTESGRAASHRAHFSWHAALHELALGDTEAVRRRYYSQLGPGNVHGVRALIDSTSLLWRWRVTTSDWDAATAHALPGTPAAFGDEPAPPPVEGMMEAFEPSLLTTPQTPFVAVHAAVALAGTGDVVRLAELARTCRASTEPTLRSVVAPVCDGLLAATEERWSETWQLLSAVLPTLVRIGGSAAQREVVEETMLFALVQDGQAERALALLDNRLDRRPSPLDERRRRPLAERAVVFPA